MSGRRSMMKIGIILALLAASAYAASMQDNRDFDELEVLVLERLLELEDADNKLKLDARGDDPCSGSPCTAENSVCVVNNDEPDCNCVDGYTWNGESLTCDSDIENARRSVSLRAASTLTNIGQAFQGYNLYYGNPLGGATSTRDPGFKTQIFKADYSEGRLTADQNYKLPKGINAGIHEECTTSFEGSVATSMSAYSSNLQTSVEVSGGYGGGSFSASTDYQKAESGMESSNKVYSYATASCAIYYTTIDPHFRIPPLSESFGLALKGLKDANNQQCFDFFDRFGTHYVKDMRFGSRFTYEYEMTESDYQKMTSSSIDVAVQAEYSGMISVGASVSFGNDEEAQNEEFNSNTKKSSVTVGSRPSADGDVLSWAATSLQTNPAPMHYAIEGIETLLTQQHFGSSDIDYAKVKQKLEQALPLYCPHLKGLNKLKSCDVLPPYDPADAANALEAAFLDRWTRTYSGCNCWFSTNENDCACCHTGGCQCKANNRHKCTRCGHDEQCEIFTKSETGCNCYFDASRTDCACCLEGGCQCDGNNAHTCVKCNDASWCDYYTRKQEDDKCECYWDKSRNDCACCVDGGCPCDSIDPHKCVKCNDASHCDSTRNPNKYFGFKPEP